MEKDASDRALASVIVVSAACPLMAAVAAKGMAVAFAGFYKAALGGKPLPFFTDALLSRYGQSPLFLAAFVVMGLALGAVGLVSIYGRHREKPAMRFLQMWLAFAGPFVASVIFVLLLVAVMLPMVSM